MPLYEYECPKDGVFERIQKFSDPPLAACPSCGGPIEKLASAPAIQFKGTGWYVTDYARKSSGEGKEKAGKEPAKETGKESSASKTGEAKSSSTEAKSSSGTAKE